MDCLGKETVPVSGRSGAQSTVASTSSKRECAGCEGVQSDFLNLQ